MVGKIEKPVYGDWSPGKNPPPANPSIPRPSPAVLPCALGNSFRGRAAVFKGLRRWLPACYNQVVISSRGLINYEGKPLPGIVLPGATACHSAGEYGLRVHSFIYILVFNFALHGLDIVIVEIILFSPVVAHVLGRPRLPGCRPMPVRRPWPVR